MQNFTIDCAWALLCKQSIINQESGNISLIEVLEEITVPNRIDDKAPFIFFDFDLVVYWKKQASLEKDEYIFKLKIVSPSQELLLEGERTIDFEEESRVFTVLEFAGFPVPEPGVYKFHIQLPNDHGTEWEDVELVELLVYYDELEL
ncbi:MAG: hypothetical protein H0X31_05260 [Nostocaceae cyanobacterium]|nr:hypothetical protein [Nostocaceae cyanobacterium]